MTTVLTPTGMTPQQYLDWESTQQEKHEYVGGQVYAMTGARLNHNRIALNAVASLRQALRGRPCEAFMSDVKLQIGEPHAFTWPVAALFEGVPFDPPAGAAPAAR